MKTNFCVSPGVLILYGRWGRSDAFAELELFRQQYMQEGKRDVEGAFIGRLAALPLSLPWVAAAAFKCALTCPAEYLVKNVAKFIGLGELDSLKAGKAKHQAALQCEAFLSGFRTSHAGALGRLSTEERTALLTKLDSAAIRLLLNKKCKYNSFPTLEQDLARSFGGSGVAPGPAPSQSEQIISFTGGAARLADRLLDLRIKPGSWVEATEAVPHIEAGNGGCVQRITADGMVLLVGAVEVRGVWGGNSVLPMCGYDVKHTPNTSE